MNDFTLSNIQYVAAKFKRNSVRSKETSMFLSLLFLCVRACVCECVCVCVCVCVGGGVASQAIS